MILITILEIAILAMQFAIYRLLQRVEKQRKANEAYRTWASL